MKLRLSTLALILSLFSFADTLLANTWYVRADGGTRYTVNAPQGQCDGLADAAYPGTGFNQHCAFGDYRYLYDDQSYGNWNGKGNWAIAGGDTVILDNTRPWRVGFDGDASTTDPWCFGGTGPFDCTNPPIPAGTALQHTRILGRNYATCNKGDLADNSQMSEIFGGHGVTIALNLKGAQYVDVQCIQITRHSQCVTHGYPAFPYGCSTSVPLDDYDSDGIQTDVNTHDLLLQDLWIHGHNDRGIKGPIGGLVKANRVDIAYNSLAGWDFDDGTGSNNGYGTASVNGTLNFSHSIIEWSGCNQEYPIVDTYPAVSCYGQSNAGYGDGIGTPPGMGLNVEIDHSIFRYNTQDGEDFGHIDTGSSTLSITDSISYGNNGGQFKWGPAFSSAVFENNLAVANCARMSEPMIGAPSSYNTNLGDFCRAGDAISFNIVNNGTLLYANNTLVTYAPTTFDLKCNDPVTCANSVMTFSNNIVRAYSDPIYDYGGNGAPGGFCGTGCNDSTLPVGKINRYNNSYFGLRYCPAGNPVGSTGGTISGETCNDALFSAEPPSFLDEATLDAYNFALSSGSPAINAGVVVSGLTSDYDGVTRPSPPSLGALEYVTGLATPALSFVPIPAQLFGAAPITVSAASASSGAITYAVASGPATLSGTMLTLTGAGTVVLTATQAATPSYSRATATTSFTVSAETPSLSFAAISGETFGAAPFTVDATSASAGTVTYAVVSGPATIAGDVVSITGAGRVVLSASQAASGSYGPATATAALTVAPASPTLSFAPIATQLFSSTPFTVSATSASSGTVTYMVSSGPATLSGSVLTITGAGTVILNATQAAAGNYAEARATTSFTVVPNTAVLSFAPVPTQMLGNPPLIVSATSLSPGAVTYAVVGGPATISGNVVTLAGTGLVTLSASQAATANYLGATAATSFEVTLAPGKRGRKRALPTKEPPPAQ